VRSGFGLNHFGAPIVHDPVSVKTYLTH
jgi:hypothetical protein